MTSNKLPDDYEVHSISNTFLKPTNIDFKSVRSEKSQPTVPVIKTKIKSSSEMDLKSIGSTMGKKAIKASRKMNVNPGLSQLLENVIKIKD